MLASELRLQQIRQQERGVTSSALSSGMEGEKLDMLPVVFPIILTAWKVHDSSIFY